MSSKRSHTKSRLGCTQCKEKHIKCDETPPRCSNCSKKGIRCDYEDFKLASENIQFYKPVDFEGKPPPTSDIISANTLLHHELSASFTLNDMGLLHHFTLYTSLTLPPIDDEHYRHIWQHEVPRLAQSYDFLMHAVLCFAAAHQATLLEGEKALQGVEVARNHYSVALGLFRQSVKEITADGADALLCFCILVSLVTLHLESVKDVGKQDPIGEFVAFLDVLRTSAAVLMPIQASLRNSLIGHLLQHTWNTQTHEIEPNAKLSLDYMENRILQHFASDPNSAEAIEVSDAMTKLRRFYTLSSPRPSSWAYLLSYPISLGSGFGKLLQKRNPIIMCALAHWTVAAYNVPAKWFTGAWPRSLMLTLEGELSSSPWSECMNWSLGETIGRNKAPLNTTT